MVWPRSLRASPRMASSDGQLSSLLVRRKKLQLRNWTRDARVWIVNVAACGERPSPPEVFKCPSLCLSFSSHSFELLRRRASMLRPTLAVLALAAGYMASALPSVEVATRAFILRS